MIRITIPDKLARQLSLNPSSAMQAGATAVAAEVQDLMARYPSASKRKQPPRSAAQRRAVFALIKQGKIPYKRTGQLGQRWDIQQTATGASLRNNRPGAALVYGRVGRPGDQAAYHRGTWQTADDGAALARRRAPDLMQEAIDAALERA